MNGFTVKEIRTVAEAEGWIALPKQNSLPDLAN